MDGDYYGKGILKKRIHGYLEEEMSRRAEDYFLGGVNLKFNLEVITYEKFKRTSPPEIYELYMERGFNNKDDSKVRKQYKEDGGPSLVEWAEEAIKTPNVKSFLMDKIRTGAISYDQYEKITKMAHGFLELDRKQADKEWAESQTLRAWQLQLHKILDQPANMRDVYWIYDKDGNSGKTWFTNYVSKYYPDEIYATQATRAVEMLYQLASYTKVRAMILDIPRNKAIQYLSYDTIEAVKSGQVNSTKYVPIRKSFDSMHVICFSNSWPNVHALSLDRWKVYELISYCGEKQMINVKIDNVIKKAETEGYVKSYGQQSDDKSR